jgi:signal transduction histidine kinase
LVINAAFYTIALFGFRIFDPIPMARKAVIEQMLEGMLVLDTSQNIVDLNPAAEKLLGLPAARVRGRDAAEFLPAHVGMSARSDDGWMAQTEISLGARFYDLQHLPLKDWDGQALGHLILLHDVTEQKQAQAQLMEQQRALAALKEREQVARELHDELSQGLAFINLQAQAAGELLTAGDSQQAAAHLARLAEVARGTQADVREQITGLSLGILPQEGFLGALRRFMETFSRPYGIQAELNFPDGGSAIVLEPTAEVQLLRIIQEAFTNIRKHSDARRAQVSLAMTGTGMEVIVEDDGRGFDSREGADSGGTFGLRFMGERAAEIGGSLRVESEAGRGTRVIVRVPQTRLPKS